MNSSEQKRAAIPGAQGRDYPLEAAGDPPERSPRASQFRMSHKRRPGKEELSPTQERILRLLANPESEAESSQEIAAELHITTGAVEQHLHRMYAFYGVRSMRGLFRRAALHAAQIAQISKNP